MSIFFPNTIVDGFFENPDAVVDFANKQEFRPSEDGRWPGLRTKSLYEIDKDFFDFVCRKIFSTFFNVWRVDLDWVVHLEFQKVSKEYKDGWIHTDDNMCTGIIYLSKNAPLDTGTSLYRLKEGVVGPNYKYEQIKRDSYTNKIPLDQANQAREASNYLFEETLNVKNVYNRLFFFDGYQHHKANNFKDSEERLTLVAFVHKINASSYVSSRLRAL